uniref:SERTA domain-containing protein n=1 Tax=Heterorhabditis bacteriophora TaxID=37862 RepID=A0A1I7XID5_HETBA
MHFVKSPYSYEDSSSPVERYCSSLSSSAESISSIKSNIFMLFASEKPTLSSASRSPAEREAERMQRRQLLDSSLSKMRASNNLPLRKHLLIFNTIKQLQRDLDLLDDEDLYCSLIGEECHHMEVDECRWLAPPVVAPAAPPSQEEHRAASVPNNIMVPLNASVVSIVNDDLDMDTSPTSPATTNTWSWSSSSSDIGLFESIQVC